jgi:alanyl-tRNA synthetase
VDAFDYTPCGGTHCRRTGEIGLIKVIRSERIRNHVRLHFLCGHRTLSDYRLKSNLIKALSDRYTTGEADLLARIRKLDDDYSALRNNFRALSLRMIPYEARELLGSATVIGDVSVIQTVFQNRTADDLKALARKIIQAQQAVVLIGNRGETAQLVFACSEGLSYPMNDLVRQAGSILGGRGGGSPRFAFGGGPLVDKIDEAIRYALSLISD